MTAPEQVEKALPRATGLLVIEVVNSNPNGDPDRESDPRCRPDGLGEISPVSFKRKLRDLVEEKEGPVWLAMEERLKLQRDRYYVLESRGRDRAGIRTEIAEGKFTAKYWDARLFGNTFLEKEGGKEGRADWLRTGAVHFGLGLSVDPIAIERMTNTNKAGVEADKDRGMAPLAYRIVPYGVYVMPFFVNPTAGRKSGCTREDIELMLNLIPYAYAHTRSYVRPHVELRHAWHIEHKDPLGSCSDFALIDALRPRRRDPESAGRLPANRWEDYDTPTGIPDELKARVGSVRDLVEEVGSTAPEPSAG